MRLLYLSILFSFPVFSIGSAPIIELMGELQFPDSELESVHDLIVHDRVAYVGYWDRRNFPPRILMVDLSNPTQPAVVGEYNVKNAETSSVSPSSFRTPHNGSSLNLYARAFMFNMDLDYPHLYIPHRTGFDIVDVSDPSAPMKVGEYAADPPLGWQADSIRVIDSKAIFTHPNTMEVLEFDEQFEVIHKTVIDSHKLLREGRCSRIHWDGGDYVYLLTQDFSRSFSATCGIQVLNVSQFEQPQLLPFYPFPIVVPTYGYSFGAFFGKKPFLFTSEYSRAETSHQIPVFDISNPEEPVHVHTIPNQPRISDIIRIGDYFVGSADMDGLAVYHQPNADVYPTLMERQPLDNQSVLFLDGQQDLFVSVGGNLFQQNFVKVYRMQLPSHVQYFDSFQ